MAKRIDDHAARTCPSRRSERCSPASSCRSSQPQTRAIDVEVTLVADE